MDTDNEESQSSDPAPSALAPSLHSGGVSSTSSASIAYPPISSERDRRASIQAIMRNTNLTEKERRRLIQNVMDGRRRNSLVTFQQFSRSSSSTTAAASVARNTRLVQEEFTDSDDESRDLNGAGELISPLSNPNRKILKRAHSAPVHSSSGSSNMTSLRCLKLEDLNLTSMKSSVFRNAAYNLHGEPVGDPEALEKSRPPCSHYERICSIISPCCGMVFGCRICHDDCDDLIPPIQKEIENDSEESQHIPRKIKVESGARAKFSRRSSVNSIMSSISEMGDDIHHNIDRFAIKETICRKCYTRQSSKTNKCIKCGIRFGEYHCDICNLWMSASEEPYHCKDCGFCRVGGKDKYRHCFGCGMCICEDLFEDHNCKAGKYMANCPVCYEDLFQSRSLTHEMPCGHNIHWHCFQTLVNHDSRCPICKKTATQEDMSEVWTELAMNIAQQPIPPDQAQCVTIVCNDCGVHEDDRRWHYLGVQCRKCNSFNTLHDVKMTGQEAHDHLAKIDAEERDPNPNL